ncbi:methionine--tRNA ligase [Lapillicoccus jejuensis]|uniref:Methionine--tRNA ligase n=1 Tax=Lapillicoccus jejuensis TaxID=402171 RepID=A0A542E1C4_9MICO|nr:methionine--tRNA ligase [Lapillicoccus jejuensis]TQJ09137.1 methionyl-tRNA synthetase [Lapillicoccus jejuensis]
MTKVLSAVAWPYANGPRHIGHVAGFGVPSDVFSRYMRMAGHDVLMVSGTDEHGTPILVAADEQGVTARELADRYNRVIAEDLTALGLSYDLFTRTTTRNHYAVAQELFTGDWRNGYMVEQTTRGAISPSTGRTLPDRYIEGTCPICGYGQARGDQCDNCGNQLDATELIDPRSKINGETPQFVETQHFFLDLPALAGAIGAWLDEREREGSWRPSVLNFSKNLLEDVRPRAMTRDLDWGIPVPIEGWREQPTKRFYVWFDAVVGYLSASIEWARRVGDPERWRDWWNDPAAESYYFQGKDNITFHSLIWPAELLAYAGKGDKGGEPGPYGVLNLPTEVVASQYLTMGAEQFSSSRGHVVYVRDVLADYGPDPLRYFICAAGPETQDAEFTWDAFVQRNNSELVAGWGNLVNRTASMVHKQFGEVPAAGPLEPVDEALLDAVRGGFDTVGGLLARQRVRAAIAEVMRLVGEANAYVSRTEPFRLKGEDERERLGTVLHVLVQVVTDLNTMMSPFLPHSSNAVHRVLGGEGDLVPMPRLEEVEDLDGGPGYPVITGEYSATPAWGPRPVVPGTPIGKPAPVFRKFDPPGAGGDADTAPTGA